MDQNLDAIPYFKILNQTEPQMKLGDYPWN